MAAPPAPRVDAEQVRKAAAALFKWAESRKQAAKPRLLADAGDEDDMFYLVVALKKTPEQGRTSGFRIPLPYSLYPADSAREICLIVRDSAEAGHKEAKARVAAEGVAGVTKVIGVRKLRANYKPFEAKRQLCGSYDLFVADERVLPLLPTLLGKTFFKKKKHPVPVSLTGRQWGDKIRAAVDATYLYVSGGPCSVVRAARLSNTLDEVVENVMAVIEGVAAKVPRKWKNIQSLYLKTQESAALPIFQALPELPLRIATRIELPSAGPSSLPGPTASTQKTPTAPTPAKKAIKGERASRHQRPLQGVPAKRPKRA